MIIIFLYLIILFSMKNLSKIFAPVLLATGLTVWWPVWCAQKETADQVDNALTTQVDNDAKRKAMQNEINDIYEKGSTLRWLQFVKQHSTPEEFNAFVENLLMAVIDEQYPWYLNPSFFLGHFLNNNSDKFYWIMEGRSLFNNKDSWVPNLQDILSLVDIKNVFDTLSEEKKQAILNYYEVSRRFYDKNQSQIDSLVGEYEDILKRYETFTTENSDYLKLKKQFDEKESEFFTKRGIKRWEYNINDNWKAHDEAFEEFYNWLVEIWWVQEEELAKKNGFSYAPNMHWSISPYVQPKIKSMKWYKELDDARKTIHQLRINSWKTDNVGLDGVSSQEYEELNFLTLKAFYRWFGDHGRRLVMDGVYNQLNQE